jgi:hypothetical protein
LKYVESFISKAKSIHGDLYDYSLVEDVGYKVPVTIVCKVHGPFIQRKDVHSRGGGCKKCLFENMPLKRTISDFVEEALSIHNNKYDYSLVTSAKTTDKIDIICQSHGVFSQTVAHHLVSRGCPECSFDEQRLSQEDFITKSSEIHENKYDYSEVVLTKGFKQKVNITCPIHGVFSQDAGTHMSGKGCRKCGSEKGLKARYPEYTTEFFIERSKEVHGDKYSYSLSEYINTETKIKIICQEHGPFDQRPLCHIKGKGCAKCRNDNTTYNFIQKYRDNPELGSRDGIIYILEIFNEKEKFLKLGISSDSYGRFKKYRADFKKVGYSFNILFKFETTNYISAMVENDILKTMRRENNTYTPTENFSGKGECLFLKCLDDIVNLVPVKLSEYTVTGETYG